MVPISPEIYSSTAVVMDNRSLADYIQRLEDRRMKRAAAEQEAFDEWNKANEKQLDPSNMRWAKEGPQFTKGLEEYRALSLEAKKNPRDYTKRLAAQKKADDLLALVRASREAKEIDKEWDGLIKTAIGNPEYDYEAILQRKAIHDLPIGWKAGGLMGVPVMERPANTAPEMDLYKPKPSNIVEDFDKNISGIEFGTRISPTDKDYNYLIGYTPESTKAIAERVYDYVNQNSRKRSSYKVEAQSLLKNNPAKLAEYTLLLKNNGINKEVDVDDPAALAMAKAIEEAKRRGKTVRDVGAYARYQSGLIEGRAQRRLNLLQSGNVIDNFPDTPISRGTQPTGSIQGGVVYDNNGNLYNGEFRAAYEKLPADLPAVLSFAKIKLNKKPFTVEVKDGVIQSIKQDGGLKIGRQIIENAQRKFGKGMEFGPQGQQGFTDDPLGILD